MIAFLSSDTLDHTALFSIRGVRYEYWLNPTQLDTVRYMASRVSSAKAFAYAKCHASRCDRIVIPVAPFPVAPPRKVS